jgi:hypothetical protein
MFRHMQVFDVCSGPFQGMHYIPGSVGSSLTPKILGTYEMEVASWISRLPHFQLGLDVGAAEGYYAVGLLRKGTCDRMIAWEMDPTGRDLLCKLADANSMRERLDIRGCCDPSQLGQEISKAEGEVLVVIDCEGFEGDLLPPLDKNLLERCTFVIETHNPMNPGVHERLLRHLEPTHEIEEVFPRRRKAEDFPGHLCGRLKLLRIPLVNRLAMTERRPAGLGWLLCRPKAGKLQS